MEGRDIALRLYGERAYRVSGAVLIQRDELNKLVALAKEGGCVECGERRLAALDLHHRDPAEKIDAVSRITRGWAATKEEAEEEISKCEVLCANCHRVRHAEQNLPKTLV